MMKLSMPLINSAAQDAGNRSMRSAGRSKWAEEDYNMAAREFERLVRIYYAQD